MSANPDGQRMPRPQRAAQVKRLKDAGLTFDDIANYLGIARSTVTSVYYDPTGAKDRARKAKYDGVCQDCGGRTGYRSDGTPGDRCRPCALEREKTVEVRLARHYPPRPRWTDDQILDAIRSIAVDGVASVGDYQAARAQDPDRMPSVPLIFRRFRKWSAAVERAGCSSARGPYHRTDAITDEGLWLAIEDCAAEYGRPPTSNEYGAWARRTGSPSLALIRNRLGGWQDITRTLAADPELAQAA